jgi:hypothetical protein
MPELIIILMPYNKKLSLKVSEAFYNKIVCIAEKIKSDKRLFVSDIPEIGYCGMILIKNNTNKIYVNNETVIIFRDGIIETLYDRKKRISNLLIKKALPKHFEELKYFFTVSCISENRHKKERSKKIDTASGKWNR